MPLDSRSLPDDLVVVEECLVNLSNGRATESSAIAPESRFSLAVQVQDGGITSGQQKQQQHARRRVYAPARPAAPRYLLAREVLQAGGYPPASVDAAVKDLFVTAARKAGELGLPAPHLPPKASCQFAARAAPPDDNAEAGACGRGGPHGAPKQLVYVLAAQDLLMLAWAVPDSAARCVCTRAVVGKGV